MVATEEPGPELAADERVNIDNVSVLRASEEQGQAVRFQPLG
jgi:hypothetical protein